MIRMFWRDWWNVTGLPRTRGDDPAFPSMTMLATMFAPHARG